MILIGLIAILVTIDLCIKKAVEDQDEALFPKELEGSGGKIMLYKNHNPGFSFGFLKESPEAVLLIPMAVVSALAGIFAWLMTRKGYLAEKMAVSITLGGALSNLYDRLVRHYVVDYFSIQWKFLKKVVFNLGDIFILLGMGMMLFLELIRSIKER